MSKNAFTLVELLVVVTIITILAAMLLPALEKSLMASRQAACANNHRQIYMAFDSYCATNGDWLPRFNTQRWTGDWVTNRGWVWNMREELADEINANGATTLLTAYVPTVKPNSFLRCPASNKDVVIGMNPYGIGAFIYGQSNPKPYHRFSQVKRPSRQIGFGDVAGSSSPAGIGGHFPYGDIGYWHDSKTTSLFLDGHTLAHNLYSVKYMYIRETYPSYSLENLDAWGFTLNHWWGRCPWGNP